MTGPTTDFHKLDDRPLPNAWINFKDSDVCLTLRCVCGHVGHLDAEFLEHYKCKGCGALYNVGHTVTLHPIPLGEEIDHCQVKEGD